MQIRERANCLGSRVGALLARDGHIVSTGYNGTPHNMLNCDEGGCPRCSDREKYAGGSAYDLCICVHAEQNALLAAARFGHPVENSVLYTTVQPCFGCTKELLQARVHAVYYLKEWLPSDPALKKEYLRIQAEFPGKIRQLEMRDPQEAWATSPRRKQMPETGHHIPGN